MTVNVNPDPHAEGFKPQPILHVTAIFDELDDVISAIGPLQRQGFSDYHVSVFLGKDGLAKLDLHGEGHGALARVVRNLESLTAEAQANQDAEAALKDGRIFIAVETDGSENQKLLVARILKERNAHTLRFFGRWTVQHL